MYQVVYDENGAVDHAIRYTDRDLVVARRELIIGLYELCSESISEFYRREIAPLPPPLSCPCPRPGRVT